MDIYKRRRRWKRRFLVLCGRGGLSSLLLFVLLLWPWWVSVSLVLELLYSSFLYSPSLPISLSLKKMTMRGNQG